MKSINLHVEKQEIIVICGPSGSGKSTLIRCINMIVVSHEMGFAKSVANRVMLMDDGMILEENNPVDFFENPQHERSKFFLGQILN